MYAQTQLLFLYCESPLRAGLGSGLDVIDQPIQRETLSRYPLIQGSGLKGALRRAIGESVETNAAFGKPVGDNLKEDRDGLLAVGDASLLAFPVTSLKGTFAWVTCRELLARLSREHAIPGLGDLVDKRLNDNEAFVVPSGGAFNLLSEKSIYLDNIEYQTHSEPAVAELAAWLADYALPLAGYDYWRTRMRHTLVVLHQNAMRHIVTTGTEVATRVRLNLDKRTTEVGGLWTEEALPADTLLFAPVRATEPTNRAVFPSARKALAWLGENLPASFQLGARETLGYGMLGLRWL